MVALYNTQRATQQDRLNEVVAETMKDATAKAASALTGAKKLAMEVANFSRFQTLLYPRAMHARPIRADCSLCFKVAIAYLPNCSGGKQEARVLTPSCNFRYELYPFYNLTAPAAPPSPPLFLSQPPAPQPPVTRNKGKSRSSSAGIIAIFAPIGVSILLFVLGCCFLSIRLRKKPKSSTREELNDRHSENEITMAESLQFDLATTKVATKMFTEDNKLGAGGFGEVYQGSLPDERSSQGAEEFKNEVVLLAKVQQRNLVRLLGFCSHSVTQPLPQQPVFY